jgi:NADH dehydrogenase FAD-containing subunit
MKKVVIIGCGFAGLSTVSQLSQSNDLIEITVIDRNENFHFRPLLPDVVSGTVNSRDILYPILNLRQKYGFKYICDTATDVDFTSKQVILKSAKIPYDFLVIATGSETPFPKADSFKHFALKLDTAYDADRIADAVRSATYHNIIICGAGYTGSETASQVWKLIRKERLQKNVMIVEMLDKILSTMPKWIQDYTTESFKQMGIPVLINTKVEDIDHSRVSLSNGRVIDNSLLIWATGLRPPELIKNLKVNKDNQGRIITEKDLRFSEGCYAAGDSSCFKKNGECLRMSVQFSIQQGACVAENIHRQINGISTTSFKEKDPGLILPMSNGRSAGSVFDFRVTGWKATILHYTASIYYVKGIFKKAAIASNLILN